MNTYKKTQVTKLYKRMFGEESHTKEETISNYKILKTTVSSLFQKEIDRRIEQLSK